MVTGILYDRLYGAYKKLYASMHDRGIGPYKTQFRRDENYGIFWSTFRIESGLVALFEFMQSSQGN